MTKMARKSSLSWITTVLDSAESSRESERGDDCLKRHGQTSRGGAIESQRKKARDLRTTIGERRLDDQLPI